MITHQKRPGASDFKYAPLQHLTDDRLSLQVDEIGGYTSGLDLAKTEGGYG